MADRLTQLQDAVNVQAENLCNSIGLLQQCAKPTPFPEFSSFSRTSSAAYQQVLAQAGIPTDENTAINITNEENGKEKLPNSNTNSNDNKSKQNGDISVKNGDVGINNISNETVEPVDNSILFAKLITKTAKDIDLIIDSLPSREMEPELQEAHIRRLETENHEEAKKLELVIKQAEELSNVLQHALEDIAQNSMRMKQLESQMLTFTTNSTNITPSSTTTNTANQHQHPSHTSPFGAIASMASMANSMINDIEDY